MDYLLIYLLKKLLLIRNINWGKNSERVFLELNNLFIHNKGAYGCVTVVKHKNSGMNFLNFLKNQYFFFSGIVRAMK